MGSDAAPEALLERVADARKAGVSIFALDRGDDELDSLADEYLQVRRDLDPVSFDGAQHLVSTAVGEPDAPRRRPGGDMRGRLARLLDAVSGTQES